MTSSFGTSARINHDASTYYGSWLYNVFSETYRVLVNDGRACVNVANLGRRPYIPLDVILDPFMGSGTTAIAALKSDRKYVGYEIDPEYLKLAEERIAPYKLQISMDL